MWAATGITCFALADVMEGSSVFQLNKKERAAANEFIKKQDKPYAGAIGGQFSYIFTPTSIGCVIKVLNHFTGEECDVTDYEEW